MVNLKYNFVDGSIMEDIEWDRLVNPLSLANKAYANPYVSMVINRIANSASALKTLEDSPEYFNKSVAYKIYVNLLLYGEVFIYPIKGTGLSKVNKLEVLVTPLVGVHHNESSIFKDITGYTYLGNKFEVDDIIHIMYDNPNSEYPRGLSPLHSSQSIYESSTSILKFEQYLYKNRGVVGILSADQGERPMVDKQRKEIQAQFQDSTAGFINAGKIMLSPISVKYTPLTFKPTDMAAGDSQLQKLRAICSIYNVSSSLFNDEANQTYNNVKEAKKAFYTDSVLPLAEWVGTELSTRLGDLIELDLDVEVLREEKEKKEKTREISLENSFREIELLETLLEKGVLSKEEFSERLRGLSEKY